jgi:high-affinity iron transporter
MGINGLQLAGVLPATINDNLPTIPWLAVYPSWQCFIAQSILIIAAIILIMKNYIKSK